MRASALSRKIALKDAQNGFQYISDLDGRAYCSINVEGIENPGDIKKFLPRNYRENGEFSVFGSDRIKIHKRDELALSDIIWDNSKEYTPYEWDNFVTEVLNNKTLWLEYKYVPSHKYDIFFRYQNKKEQKLKKEEHAVIDVGFDYDNKFVELYTKISSLCDCKSGAEKEECKSEAYRLTEQYFQMWGLFAMFDESWGIKKAPCNCQIKIDEYNHISSGWLCYQWAYFTMASLKGINTSHFTIQKSSYIDYIPDDPITDENEEDYTVHHNWVTVFTCNPSENRNTDNGINLDPWINIKLNCFTAYEHEERMKEIYHGSGAFDGRRTFIAPDLNKKEEFIGYYVDEDGNKTYIYNPDLFGCENDW